MNYATLEQSLTEMVANAKLLKTSSTAKIAAQLLKNRDRFLKAQALTGVPALWLMPVFYREGGKGFGAYFGNGDPLDKATTHVPKGRGPFATWEEGVDDALQLDHITQVDEWTWPRACYQWELYNGFGPRSHGRPSGYVWSWTNEYSGGKYVADGVWSPGTWDAQCGCFALAKAIATLDKELGAGLDEAPLTS